MYTIVKSNNVYFWKLGKGAGTPYRRVPLQNALLLFNNMLSHCLVCLMDKTAVLAHLHFCHRGKVDISLSKYLLCISRIPLHSCCTWHTIHNRCLPANTFKRQTARWLFITPLITIATTALLEESEQTARARQRVFIFVQLFWDLLMNCKRKRTRSTFAQWPTCMTSTLSMFQ